MQQRHVLHCDDHLVLKRLPAELLVAPIAESHRVAFLAELCALASKISAEAPPDKRREHASKTYCLVAAVAREVARVGEGADFFVLGQFRGVEKARAHMHSSYALGVYDCARFAAPVFK